MSLRTQSVNFKVHAWLHDPFFHDHDNLLSSSKVDSYTTTDMIDGESMNWLDQLLQDVQEPGPESVTSETGSKEKTPIMMLH